VEEQGPKKGSEAFSSEMLPTLFLAPFSCPFFLAPIRPFFLPPHLLGLRAEAHRTRPAAAAAVEAQEPRACPILTPEALEDRRLFAAYSLAALGSLAGYSDFTATGLNNLGQVVGYASDDSSSGTTRAFVSKAGATSAVAGNGSLAYAINDAGTIVGEFDTGERSHAFLKPKGGALTDLTAKVSDNDYQAASGILTFRPGERTRTLSVIINGDSQPGGDEHFRLVLSSPVNGSLTRAVGIGTVLTDDPPRTMAAISDRRSEYERVASENEGKVNNEAYQADEQPSDREECRNATVR
jgi:probable HAF family extracellular repeat protein